MPDAAACSGDEVMIIRRSLAALILAAAGLAGSAAVAADYDPPIYVEETPETPEYVPVEIGSGWYLRGDLAYNIERKFKDDYQFFDESLFSNNLIGLPKVGEIGVDPNGFTSTENPVSGTLGFGYHFTDYLRADVNIGLLASDKYSARGFLNADPSYPQDYGCLGTMTVTTVTFDQGGAPVGEPSVFQGDARKGCETTSNLDNSAWNGTVNGYVDLGTFSGFTPYVGAGVGMLYTRTKFRMTALCQPDNYVGPISGFQQTTKDFQCREGDAAVSTPVEYVPIDFRDAQYAALYTVNAGVAYKFNENISLDVGYQYMNSPDIETYTITAAGLTKHEGFDGHQVKVGLRYDLW
jgi:opacity protein-like surface antigen